MLTLQLLGGLALVTEDGKPVGRAAQKRRLALLAVLAIRPGVAVSRDKLLALFWPESPTDEARHRLSAALYDLRQALGDQALIARGDEVLLAVGSVRCDVVEFEAAFDAGDWQAAAGLYRGEFLDGVHLDDAPEFDEWVEQRRTQLARAHGKALEEWARICSDRGNNEAAVEAWQRLTDIDRLNDRFAVGLMKALEAAGNRAGALRHAQRHDELLRSELGVGPDQAVRAFAANLKAQSSAMPNHEASGIRPQASDSARAGSRITNRESRTGATSGLRHQESGGLANSEQRTANSDRQETQGISSAESRITSHESQITNHESRLQRHRWLAVATVTGLLLVTPLLLRSRDDVLSAEPTAASVIAGERHLLAGRFEAAVTAFERAVTLDSTDARAHFQFALSTLWADQPGDRIDARLARAVALRDQLGELDRALLDGLVAWRRGEWHTAEGIYRRALAGHPGSIAARHELGEVLFHYNAPQGRSIDEARLEFEHVLEREPRHYGALWHLALLAAHDRRGNEVAALTDRLLALEPDVVRTLEVQALRAGASHDRVEIDRLLERLRDVDESLLFSVGWRMAVFSRDLDAADRVFSLLVAPTRGPYARALGHMHLLYVDIARGRAAAAANRLDALAGLRNTGMAVDWLAVVAAVAPGVNVPAERLRSLRDSLATVASDQPVMEAYSAARRSTLLATLGALHAVAGDSAGAMAVASRLEHAAVPDAQINASRAATIRALQAWRGGRPNEVLRWTDRSPIFRWFGNAVADPINAWSVDRFIRAEALLALGRFDEADAWFATIGDHDPSDLAFLPAALERRAQIARARGDLAQTQRLKTHLEELRSVLP